MAVGVLAVVEEGENPIKSSASSAGRAATITGCEEGFVLRVIGVVVSVCVGAEEEEEGAVEEAEGGTVDCCQSRNLKMFCPDP